MAEALESYKHITLNDEEVNEAILRAKQKKEAVLKEQELRDKEQANRLALMDTGWSVERTSDFFKYRAVILFQGAFKFDKNNSTIYDLLCHYFSDSREFESIAAALGVSNPSLEKGILLAGSYGTGKTWLMKLMQKNKKSCYVLKNSKEIANDFEADGQDAMRQYIDMRKNAINDSAMFYQPFAGLCIDDLGTENIKNNFGNKKNVIGDIFELRYDAGNTGKYLHATTNLTADSLIEFYGQRVASRLRQIFNIIELKGEDRRK